MAQPAYKYRNPKKPTHFVVHCAQTHRGQDTTLAEVRGWHVNERGWIDIGYHFYITFDGTIHRGRPVDAMGAHVENHNCCTVGICLEGGCDKDGNELNNFTPEQFDALARLLAALTVIYGETPVQGHRDFPNVAKYCPSFDAKAWWAGILAANG